MKNNNQDTGDLTQRILQGLEKSYQKLVEFKQYKKSPLIVAKRGVIMEIQHDKIALTTIYKRKESLKS